jgi:hypothetical protein
MPIYTRHCRIDDCCHSDKQAEGVLPAVGHVEEAVLILVLLIDSGHQGSCWWKRVLDEDEDCLLSTELDPLPNNIHKLSNREVSGNKVPAYR